MKRPVLRRVDQWITMMLSYPGIEEEVLAQKKIYWIASVAVSAMILCLTIAYHLIFPQLKIIIYYALFLLFIFFQGVFLPIVIRRPSVFPGVTHMFINQSLVAIASLLCILMLGGIPYSGGLILVGLALVFFSLNFNEKRHTFALYIIYVVTVILAGVLHPYLTVPPEVTPAVNVSLYVINLLWISGFAMVFVMNFISQSVRLEHLEAEHEREINQAKTRLYSNIAHEFRTPLTVINGMTDLIREEPEQWLKEGSEKIDQNTHILLNLVNQMLDLTKLESGAMPLRMIRTDINRYINNIVQLFESTAVSRGIELEYAPCLQECIIDHDPDKLLHIMSNLLSNALKFTPSSGRVEVRTLLREDNWFEIRVTDNGPGIPAAHIDYIFDRFYRVEDIDREYLPGSGLGLPLVKEMVNLLGGRVSVRSVQGEGATFIIHHPVTDRAPLIDSPELKEPRYMLPVSIPQEDPQSLTASSDYLHGDKPLLLIVEDNPDVIRYELTFLDEEYDVMCAVNGQEGLEKTLKYVPDIVLSDVIMPVMDGIEMLKRVKNDMRTSHIPVVLLTAKADIDSRIEGLERGADAYIDKPFDRDELFVILRSLVEIRRKLMEKYAVVEMYPPSEEKEKNREDTFMQQVRDIMTEHLEDEHFDVSILCREIGMSRSQLYRKFKFLTDKTVTGYLKSLRLHRARELLLESGITVSEAAYKTGFRNISHFSRAFTREFAINPSEIGR